jgi:tripartite-type tricarboxylate transporter receptor subunit TctC
MAGMEMSAWQGVVVPTGTPEPIVRRLNAELLKVLAHEETRAKLIAQGTEILGSTPQEYAAYLKSELARWSKVVAESGAKVE